MLYNRPLKTRLPQVQIKANNPEVRQKDKESKAKQKLYKDANKTVRPHKISVGDDVLAQQKKTKTTSRYDPNPFKVTEVKGTQIKATRDGVTKTRDAQKFKKIKITNPKMYERQRQPFIVHPAEDNYFSFMPKTPGPSMATNDESIPDQNVATTSTPNIRTSRYPNGHLEPNVSTSLERNQRSRGPPQRYGLSF